MLGVRFTLVREGSLVHDIAERAKDAKPILRQWGALIRAAAKAQMVDKAPPLAASTLFRQQHTGTGSLTQKATVRASYARRLDTVLRRKGAEEARADLRKLLSGDLSKGTSGNKTVAGLRRRLERAKRGKAMGLRIATGKTQAERTGGQRGGKMINAWRAMARGLAVVVENSAKFSGVHDTGGKVGNGATLPSWNFSEIPERVRSELARIALDWILSGKE